jgi:hypothetical protein
MLRLVNQQCAWFWCKSDIAGELIECNFWPIV